MEFFAKGREMFASDSFKDGLRKGHESGKNAQLLINDAQASLFQSMGINGNYGLDYLGKVRKLFSNDAEMLRTFYEFVHLEEKALDEAEMPEGDFINKYEKIGLMQREMQSKEAELAAMPADERNAVVASMFKKFVESSQGGGQCGDPSCNQVHGMPMSAGEGGATMSEEEQLRFFQSLNQGPK